MKLLPNIGAIVIVVTLMALESIAWGQAGCYQNPRGGSCATNQPATVANGCVAKTYTPLSSTYCDCRDGECGMTQCQVIQVAITYMVNYGTVTSPPGDPTILYCEPGEDIGPIGTGSTCGIAQLSGDKCGYCPN